MQYALKIHAASCSVLATPLARSCPCLLRLPAATGGGAVRMSRTGRAARRRRMRVVGLCGRVAPGGSAGQDGGGGRGSLGWEWRDHRGGYRGGLLTRQHCRCNTHRETAGH